MTRGERKRRQRQSTDETLEAVHAVVDEINDTTDRLTVMLGILPAIIEQSEGDDAGGAGRSVDTGSPRPARTASPPDG